MGDYRTANQDNFICTIYLETIIVKYGGETKGLQANVENNTDL